MTTDRADWAPTQAEPEAGFGLPPVEEQTSDPGHALFERSHGRFGRQRDVALVCLATDLAAVFLAVVAAYVLRFVVAPGVAEPVRYDLVLAGVIGAWLASLALTGAYDQRFLGVGTEEFKRVLVATCLVFGVVAIVSFILMAQISRGFIVVAMPIGLVTLVSGRGLIRAWLHRRRRAGFNLARTLVVGTSDSAWQLSEVLNRDPLAGFDVVAVADPPKATEDLTEWLDDLIAQIRHQKIDAVALAQSDRITNEVVRRLAWRLEGPGVDLMVAPSLGDVGGPRLSFRPAAGLPLIHLDEPQLTGPKRFTKRALDLFLAVGLIVLIFPLLVVIAVVVATTSRGPVLFRQRRVGLHGRDFTLLKFRTMRQGSQALQAEVWSSAGAEGIANKSRTDPRVTPVGRVLRRWSLDELPQLFNVVQGTMSLVGPRPVQRVEVETMCEHEHRRHLTNPGLTGLWQISGRNETSWEERMRLDLYYVENWSPALDLVILLKTVRTVLSGHGAY